MELTFRNPGYDYMIDSIMEFQQDDTTAYWSDGLFYLFKNLDMEVFSHLSLAERRDYLSREMRTVYEEQEAVINQKAVAYQAYWEQHKEQITAAFSDAFSMDCSNVFQDIVGNITLNPVGPRYLTERRFDLFYLNSERGALGMSIHELIHYFWFYVWHELFGDSYAEYEKPSLKWILSELVVEAIMDDPRLSSLNPYYPRENGGGCIYSYFFTMVLDGVPVTDTIRQMYQSMDIHEFMQHSYRYLQAHEAEIRAHIQTEEAKGLL